ncbi:hypothetical protein Cgig2_004980 [Carnegiea gigantea]|uniref:Uncharacterized protein n=1 Tax=Carnegiea gigantea TaxID=171969 RepID=A0A9Q1KZQ6_9CARY|nr:hypothetical protein Cgig2_004980 [Carnegiea gigantea]
MVYGPIWLVVEPWIEFKEAVKGGVTSSGCIGGSHHRPQGRWQLWLPGNHWGSRTKTVVVSTVCQDRSRVEAERESSGVSKREKSGRGLKTNKADQNSKSVLMSGPLPKQTERARINQCPIEQEESSTIGGSRAFKQPRIVEEEQKERVVAEHIERETNRGNEADPPN